MLELKTSKVAWGALLVAGIMLFAAACEVRRMGKQESESSERATVAVTNASLEYFAKSLAPADVHVWLPVPAGTDPAFWRPREKTVLALQKADLVLVQGAGYESWLDKVSLPASRVVDTSAAFRDRLLRLTEAVRHRHGPEGEHVHAGYAPGTWMDPELALLQAEQVYRAFAQRWPEDGAALEASWKRLQGSLRAWQAEVDALRDAHRGAVLWASHPVYDYLARYAGWKLESRHWEPNEMPDEQAWSSFDQKWKRHPARLMLWEDEPIEPIRKALRTRQIGIVVVRPCAHRPPQGTWLEEMLAGTRRLQAALKQAVPPTPPPTSKDR